MALRSHSLLCIGMQDGQADPPPISFPIQA